MTSRAALTLWRNVSSAAPEDGLSEAFRDGKRQRSVDLGQRSVDFVQPGILSTINLEHNLRLIEI